MIVSPRQSGIEQSCAVVRARCDELGLPSWRIDASGRIIQRPRLESPAAPWFTRGTIARHIDEWTQTWNRQDRPQAAQAMPGVWLIPTRLAHRRRRSGYVVAVALGSALFESEEFRQLCDRVELDAQATRALLAPEAVWDEATVSRIAVLLDWIASDQQQLAEHEATLAGFSAQLSDSFEEISLLYSLARSLNEIEHPQKFVRLACEELSSTLSFGWIAVRFDRDPKHTRQMANRLFVSGALPCDQEAFGAETSRILSEISEEGSVVLGDAQIGLLRQSGSAVLAHPIARDGRVVGVLLAGGKEGQTGEVSSFDRKLLDATSGYLSILLDNAFLYDDQQLMFIGTLEALSASIDAKDPYTRGHSERVSHLASRLAQAAGLDVDQVERMRIAGLVHDIGKIGVPESVLCKTGRLTRSEYEQMKRHPEIGYHILKDIPLMDDLLPAVLHHHERYDGNGYPHGLRGEHIPMSARIVCVVDSFDAMSSNRTYRTAMTREEIMAELRANAGSQFDPELVEAFVSLDLSRYDELVARHYAGLERGIHELPRGAAA